MVVVIPWTTLIGQNMLGLQANCSDFTVTCNACKKVQYLLAVIWILSFPEIITQLSHQQLHSKVPKNGFFVSIIY